MKISFKSVVLSFATLSLASAEALASPCGFPGLPACEVPEPSSLPMIIGAVIIAAAVARARRK